MGAPFRPLVTVYAPSGTVIGSGSGSGCSSLDGLVQITAATNGTFRIAVSSYYGNGTGAYLLSLAKVPGEFVVSPGDEGGPLTNNVGSPGVIELGDIDMWSFEATTGDSILLRMGSPGYRPHFQIFGPRGTPLGTATGSGSSDVDAYISISATNSGTFTVLVQSFYFDGAGPYTMHLAKIPGAFTTSPGDEGGTLHGDVSQDGVIDLGDQDLWRFAMCRGELIDLRCLKLSGATFNPRLRLFGRDGILLATSTSATEAVINVTTTNSGIYTVMVDGNALNHAGSYRLTGSGIADGTSLCVPNVADPNVILGGVGGEPGTTFILLTQTNVVAPLGQWAPILTKQFDTFGTFSRTSVYNRAELQRYFILTQELDGN